MVVIQFLLLLALAGIGAMLLRRSGARSLAIRRLSLIAFAAFAATSVLFPGIWNTLAHWVGVGRGTDLLLYGVIVLFLGFVVTTYLRFRAMEVQITRLARRIALDEAGVIPRGVSQDAPSESDDLPPQLESEVGAQNGATVTARPDAATSDES
jgi:hypothetical protein